MNIPRVLAACLALTLATSAVPAFAQQIKTDTKQQKRSKTEQADIDLLLKTVDTASAGTAAPSDITINWRANDFVKGQGGSTYIPFTFTVDRNAFAKPGVALYIRVIDKNAPAPAPPPAAPAKDSKDKGKQAAPPPQIRYPWDTINFIDVPQDGRLARAIQLPTGEYEMFIAVKEKSTDEKAPATKVGLLRHSLTVPDFTKAELQTSSIILAKTVEPLQTAIKPEEQQDNPYAFGPMRITPTPDGKFAKAGELNVVFWIYGAGETNGKPDVQVEYSFYQKLDSGEKYFNKTAPQVLNGTTLPPEFSSAAGHQLPGSLVIPLTSFPPGDYRLEIKVTDKVAGGKTVTQNANFAVTAS
jgi:hypothetical protein